LILGRIGSGISSSRFVAAFCSPPTILPYFFFLVMLWSVFSIWLPLTTVNNQPDALVFITTPPSSNKGVVAG
jgi:hypothetical protein